MKRRSFIFLNASALPFSVLVKNCRAESQPPVVELLGKEAPPLFDGVNFNLRKEAADAFTTMQSAALKDGVGIYSLSSYRGFSRQLGIWNRKYDIYQKSQMSPEKIISAIVQYSSIPGTSRHHWGTDADLVDAKKRRPADALNAKHYRDGGVYKDLYQWLTAYAHEYGFFETYTDDPKRSGYEFEPWHWSYAPLSVPYLRQWSEINLHQHIAQPPLSGREFLTHEFLDDFRRKWGFGINSALLPK